MNIKKTIPFLICIILLFAAAVSGCNPSDTPGGGLTVSLSRSKLSVEIGRTATLKVTVTPDDAADKSVTWSSNNTGVVTVTDGKITAVALGEAVVTATSVADKSKSAACAVTVVAEAPDAVRHIVEDGDALTVEWDAVDGAALYEIYRSGSRLGEKTLLKTTNALTFTDDDPNAVKYENYYTVVAKDAQNKAIIGIKWNQIDNAAKYRIERADTPDGEFTVLDTVDADERSYIDKVASYDFGKITYRINPLQVNAETNAEEIIKGSFDTDSPAHTTNAGNVRGYSITRNIVITEFYPQVISFERDMFGENTYFYDAKYDGMSDILKDINRIADAMRSSISTVQMSAERFSIYFKPGEYPLEQSDARGARLDIGFYMTVAGLGLLPTQTRIGATVYTPPALAHSNNGGSNGTHNFWRAIENFEVYKGTVGWAVSQAAPMRRISTTSGVRTDYNMNGGWGSGGFTADCRFGGGVGAGGQQQWYTRNSDFASEMGGVSWNNFMIASSGKTFSSNYLTGGIRTNVSDGIKQMKEKPFLYYDTEENEYKVFVPGLRKDAKGVSWTDTDPGVGESLDMSDFYFARPGDSAAKVNRHLDAGEHIFYTPGMYECEEPVFVGNENTVVLGTGMPSLYPSDDNGEGVMLVSDVSGVVLASFVVDAGKSTKYLLRVGEPGSDKNHAENPTFISDVFLRVGGYPATPTNAEVSVDVHSNDVIGDHFWIWLADHGRATGWTRNTGAFGLIVHGDRVTMHGLFVEHYHKYQTLWLGEYGEVFFYQNELPYPVPDQPSWMSLGGTSKGWAAFKIANSVENFHGIGFGSYCTLRNNNVVLENAYEAPQKAGVKLEALYANNISVGDGSRYIENVINDVGGKITDGGGRRIATFENGVAKQGNNTLSPVVPEEQDYAALIAKIF